MRRAKSPDDATLTLRVAVSYSLALHELATNATKYGTLSNDVGSVRITWSIEAGSPDPQFRLSWQEAGGPPVRAPSKTIFGTLLIERLLVSEMGGSAKITYDPEGVRFTATTALP